MHRGDLHHYLAWVSLRSGRRRLAARHFVSSLLAGEGTLVASSVTRLTRAILSQRLPGIVTSPGPPAEERAWRERARAWLEVLRDVA